MSSSSTVGRRVIWLLVAVLFVIHQDYWWWDSKSLVLGFMPIGLFYQAVFSIAAAAVWALATRLAWPTEIEAWAAESENTHQGGGE